MIGKAVLIAALSAAAVKLVDLGIEALRAWVKKSERSDEESQG